MDQEPHPVPERAVWLRYWREADGWRFVIEDPRTHARAAFARAEDLADYLQREPAFSTDPARGRSAGAAKDQPRR